MSENLISATLFKCYSKYPSFLINNKRSARYLGKFRLNINKVDYDTTNTFLSAMHYQYL